eukprot:jgi/Psemu1/35665/gm1.35665_g
MRFTGFTIFGLVAMQLRQHAAFGAEHRRHLLEDGIECTLYYKVVEFESDNTRNEDTWACEFTREQADQFGGQDIMDIKGIPKEFFHSRHVVSGEAILKVQSGAFVERSSDLSQTTMVVPDPATATVQQLSDTDPRHHAQQERSSQRRLAKAKGTIKTLVARVIDGNNVQPTANAWQLQNDIFDDQINLKTQFAACSHNQAIIENSGIVDVKVSTRASQGSSAMEIAARAKAYEQYGNLSTKYDLVMFCMPPGSGDWLAYAYINRWDSYYNDNWCRSVSAQMHEIGHNLGLGHSGKGTNVYGDQSSMMGYSYEDDDAPEMCFNAANNYQLRWYEEQSASVNPLAFPGSTPRSYVFNGVGDYNKGGSELITMRLELYGDNGGADFYLGYNRKAGPNKGTLQEFDSMLIYRKDEGGPYGYSEKSWRYEIPLGQAVYIENYKGSGNAVYIKFKSRSADRRDATVEIWNDKSGSTPTAKPSLLPTRKPTLSPTNAGSSASSSSSSLSSSWFVPPTLSPTLSPTPSPTPSPTSSPTSSPTASPTPVASSSTSSSSTEDCADDPSFALKGNKKQNCAWVAKGLKKALKNKKLYSKIQKKCKKKVKKQIKVFDMCKKTCGMVGLGECDRR